MAKFRLYIDESGTTAYSTSDDWNRRYLGLTGVIIESAENEAVLQPSIFELRKLFSSDPDEYPILHREDLVKGNGIFKKLEDQDFRANYNTTFLELLRKLNFTICAVVLDKKSHLATYESSALHPYHYCLNVMLERYTHFLERNKAKGDVLSESRGGEEDAALKEAYRRFYSKGTYFRTPGYVQLFLSSKEIKVQKKVEGSAGLQLADLLAMPTKLDVMKTFGIITSELSDNFTRTVLETVQEKYCRNNGRVNGYGKKLLVAK